MYFYLEEEDLLKKVFKIEGMTCASCSARVEKAVKKLESLGLIDEHGLRQQSESGAGLCFDWSGLAVRCLITVM